MAFCNNCGQKLEDGDRFCNNCGKKVEDVVPVQEIQQTSETQETSAQTSGPVQSSAPAQAAGPAPAPAEYAFNALEDVPENIGNDPATHSTYAPYNYGGNGVPEQTVVAPDGGRDAAVTKKTSGLGIASMIFGIFSILIHTCTCLFPGVILQGVNMYGENEIMFRNFSVGIMVVSIGILALALILSLLGIILGFASKRKRAKIPGTGIAGIVTGFTGLALTIAAVVFIALAISNSETLLQFASTFDK